MLIPRTGGIPVSAFFERVIPGYPYVCMLKVASGLLNAQISSTAIWISSWKLYFSSAAAAWLRSRRSRHGALAGPRRRIAADSPAPASAPSQAGGVRGSLAGRATFSPAAGCWCRRRGRPRRRSLVELISFQVC